MNIAKPCPLPAGALLKKYVDSGDYTDCFCIEAGAAVTQAEYVAAFYTTRVFKLERLILKLFLDKASSDADAERLAEAAASSFAAWNVESRNHCQLLLSDYAGKTRSWLMTSTTAAGSGGRGTRLYFDSAIVKHSHAASGDQSTGFVFRSLLGLHRLYSRVLLQAAKSRLQR